MSEVSGRDKPRGYRGSGKEEEESQKKKKKETENRLSRLGELSTGLKLIGEGGKGSNSGIMEVWANLDPEIGFIDRIEGEGEGEGEGRDVSTRKDNDANEQRCGESPSPFPIPCRWFITAQCSEYFNRLTARFHAVYPRSIFATGHLPRDSLTPLSGSLVHPPPFTCTPRIRISTPSSSSFSFY